MGRSAEDPSRAAGRPARAGRPRRARTVTLLAALATLAAEPQASAPPRYGETIAVLEAVYVAEAQAHARYRAYARKAREENYPSIATLLEAIAFSEGIHARNCARLLVELGAQLPELRPQVTVASTPKNVRTALAAEIGEVDHDDPLHLERLEPEGHAGAIRVVRNGWESERRHRDMLGGIKFGATWFFGIFAKKMEQQPVFFAVCNACGANWSEFPESACPVCGGDPGDYTQIGSPPEGGGADRDRPPGGTTGSGPASGS